MKKSLWLFDIIITPFQVEVETKRKIEAEVDKTSSPIYTEISFVYQKGNQSSNTKLLQRLRKCFLFFFSNINNWRRRKREKYLPKKRKLSWFLFETILDQTLCIFFVSWEWETRSSGIHFRFLIVTLLKQGANFTINLTLLFFFLLIHLSSRCSLSVSW